MAMKRLPRGSGPVRRRKGVLRPQGLPGVRFRCTSCGKLTAGRFPRGGDGTFYFPRRHQAGGQLCLGSYSEAEWVEVKHDDEA